MSLTSETVDNVAEEDIKYCICRGAYGNKFMIACDGCEEWFHGSCININSEQAKDVDQYFCPFCKEKDPSLKTVYKKKDKHKERAREKHKEKLKRKEKRREEKRAKLSLNTDSEEEVTPKRKHDSSESKELRKRKQSRDDTKQKIARDETAKVKSETDSKLEDVKSQQPRSESTIKQRSEEPSKFKIPKETHDSSKQRNPKGDLKTEDSIRQQKEEKPKMSKEERLKILERQKQLKEEKMRTVKEDRLKVAKEEKLKQFKEERSRIVKDGKQKPVKDDKVVKVKEEKLSDVEKRREEKKEKTEEVQSAKIKEEPEEAVPVKKLVMEEKVVKEEKKSVSEESDNDADFDSFLSALSRTAKPKSTALLPMLSSEEDEDVDVGMLDPVVDMIKKGGVSDAKKSGLVGGSKKHGTPENGAQLSDTAPVRTSLSKKQSKALKKKGRPRKQMGVKNSTEVGDVDVESSEEEEKQCLGPGCCNAARPRSRYCSDECGIALAVKRIKTFMPDRREEMKRGGVARAFDEALMVDLEKQQEVAHQKIEELQNERLVIMNLIKNAKADITENNSEEDMSDDESAVDEEMDCVICGMSCTDKSAARHMERCYNKFESKLALGSTVKCHVTWESPVCDAYDRQQGTYCKKLRVLCPDHNKEKEEHSGICGCPLELSSIRDDSAVCRKSKRSCNKHIGWERLRLAEIDMQRVLQDLKLEDSFEEMRKVKYRMANRTNLIQILLNGTIPHGVDTREIT